MKNLLIGCGICLFAAFGCGDKTPEPVNSVKIENLLGSWMSLDSVIGRLPDGTFDYMRDYLVFTDDSIIFNPPYTFDKSSRTSIYSFELFSSDSINLHYIGPGEIGFVDNNWLNKVSLRGDTLLLTDMTKTYPYSHFNKFIIFK